MSRGSGDWNPRLAAEIGTLDNYVTIPASQGPVHSLPEKLGALLLLDGFGCVLLQREKKRIRHLKREIEQLFSEYLVEPAGVGYAAFTFVYWVKEVAELAYDIDDGIDKLKHEYADGSKIRRLWKKLSPLQWLADDISEFRYRLKRAIQWRKDFQLGPWNVKSGVLFDEHPLQLPLPLLHGGAAGLVGLDSSIEVLSGWLANNEGHRLKVVAVTGVGGIGKTTLAKVMYRKLRGQFDCLAFVRSSRDTDMRQLLTDLLSQIRRHQPVDAYEVPDLTKQIKAHLRNKKFFIVLDDVWTPCTWHIINATIPDGGHGSRILVTTDIDYVAQTCCGPSSKYIFYMEPLNDKRSCELFCRNTFVHQYEFPGNESEVLREIISACGGLPLATIATASILASQPDRAEQWKADYMWNSSNVDWASNPELERMKLVLRVSYNALPHCLKACMLYLCMFKEEYPIMKDKLVKLWVAEGFVTANEGEDTEEVAGSYFDELIRRGLIQPVNVGHNGDVLSCTVHHLVLSLIRYKSMVDNFIIVLDQHQINIKLGEKVRRLSLHFSNAEVAIRPSNMELSHVRSLAFFGLSKCMPSISNLKLLQVVILHLWPDHNKTVYDLTGISELYRLKVLQVAAYNLSVKLPMRIKHLKNLATLEIEGRLAVVPLDIVNLPGLLHLSLPGAISLPDRIDCIISLRALRHFDISNNSIENVGSLGELINLQDLHLTCSRMSLHQVKTVMKCLTLVIEKLSNLRSLTLNQGSPNTYIMEGGDASSHQTYCDLNNVSSTPALLKKLVLSPRICTFFVLPKWIGELHKLCILKIKVMELSSNDMTALSSLPSLTALSLYVLTAHTGRIIFGKENFLGLTYFKFMCTTLYMEFLEGTMVNVQRLKLGFNFNRLEQYCLTGLENLFGLTDLSLKIGCAGTDESNKRAVEAEMVAAIHRHPGSPVMKLKWVERLFYGDKEKNAASENEKCSL